MAQFREFDPSHKFATQIATSAACPANKISWIDAAKYCLWLSKRDKVPPDQWCFITKKDGQIDIAPDYQLRIGYRLPTEEEWVFACQAGANVLFVWPAESRTCKRICMLERDRFIRKSRNDSGRFAQTK